MICYRDRWPSRHWAGCLDASTCERPLTLPVLRDAVAADLPIQVNDSPECFQICKTDSSEWHPIPVLEDSGWVEWCRVFKDMDTSYRVSVWASSDGGFKALKTNLDTSLRVVVKLEATSILDAIDEVDAWGADE